MLAVHRIVNQPVTSNCFIVFDKGDSSECIIIDPGSRFVHKLFDFLSEEGLSPISIVLTHEHFDHCWGVNTVVEKYHIPIICSRLCAEAIKSMKRNCSVFYDNKSAFTINTETLPVEDCEFSLDCFGNKIQFISTPGHTDASVSFYVNNYLFTGDTLLKDEKTITKLPTGSNEKLYSTMVLFRGFQGDGFVIYPGHGEIFELDGYDLEKMINPA